MARPRKNAEVEGVEEVSEEICHKEVIGKTEKEVLIELYETLKSRGIHSIGDLENLIANIR